jgi:hypothetical protein
MTNEIAAMIVAAAPDVGSEADLIRAGEQLREILDTQMLGSSSVPLVISYAE